MNQNNQDTNDILDAIKSMMSNDQVSSEQKLPKEVIELTKPIYNKKDQKIDDSILELTELVTEDQKDSISLAKESPSHNELSFSFSLKPNLRTFK